ncbi:MAG TPA: M23 family metallopeptidase [Candidatus Acidoferrales bacterium]|nr:M23 family metallopeptidase [Candidatus Acidoferrales bacterium]
MNQEYFVVVLAHSLRGRLRRIQVPHTAVYAILGLALLGCFSAFGFVASYARMAWKVANYNALRREADALRARYQNLQKVVSETNVQMASLQLYAKEVSVAYGIKQKLEGPPDIAAEGKLVPSFAESLKDYNYLLSVEKLGLTAHRTRRLQADAKATPHGWPVEGRLMSGFAERTDPFSGEGAFHKGVDISAPAGTQVHSAAEGVVVLAEMVAGGYGRLVIIDHGGGVQTYYAHLSRIAVHTGQEVHSGDLVGAVGSSGRTTAPHLHYEVRVDGTPRNPIRYLASTGMFRPTTKDLPF